MKRPRRGHQVGFPFCIMAGDTGTPFLGSIPAGREGLVMGQGGGGLLGGCGLVLGGADGDGLGDSECCKLCVCAA